MQDDTANPVPVPSLRERLQARGAKPHRRLSDLSRYMLDHRAELHALLAVDGYGWADIAALLAEEEGLTDETGKPVSAENAKLTWSRLNRRAASSRQPAHAAPHEISLPPTPAESSTKRDMPFAGPEPPLAIRPARPRGASGRPATAENLDESNRSLLSEDEVERRLADLAGRQGGPKIPPPEVL